MRGHEPAVVNRTHGSASMGRSGSAGQDEGLIVSRRGLGELAVDLDHLALVEVVVALDLAAVRRDDLDLGAVSWYEAFGCWKTAVILQQLYARSVRKETSDPRMKQRGEMVGPLALRALLLLGGEA